MARFSRRVPRCLEPNRLSQARALLGDVPLDLTVSNPTRCGFPYPDDLLVCLGDQRGLIYQPDPRGPLPAREAVAATYRRWGADVDPARVLLTASTSEAHALLFKLLCDPGDVVAVPTPSYPLFEQLTRLEGVIGHPLPLDPDDDWRPVLATLRSAPRNTRVMVVVHPNNPTGSFIHPEDAAAIAAICRERGLALIADEVFLPYELDGGAGAGTTFANVDECLTFTLGGFSKSLGLPQLKLAWIVVGGPDNLTGGALEHLDHIADAYLSVATPVAAAAPHLLAAAAPIQSAIAARCRTNLEILRQAAAAQPAITVFAVGGGWSVLVRLPAVLDDEELAVRLLEDHGVAVQPGYFFDLPPAGAMVLSLLTPEPVWREGLRRILDFVGKTLT